MVKRTKRELVRRLRYGALLRLFRYRWGYVLPDDDAGRGDLWELVLNVSLAASPDEKVSHVIALWAPWMDADGAACLIERVKSLTVYERTPTAKELGKRLRVTNAERQMLKLWPFKPVDASDDEVTAQARDRRNATRRAKRGRTRAQYLDTCLSTTRPWLGEAISRRTWERRRAKSLSQVAVPIILSKERPRVATPERRIGRKGLQGATGVKTERITKKETARTESSHALGSPRLRPRVATQGVEGVA